MSFSRLFTSGWPSRFLRREISMKSRFIDKVIDRLDRMDPGSLQSHFLRLAQEKGLMETILQAVQEGIVVVNAAGEVIYTNHSAGKLLGFQAETAEGNPIARYIPGIDWDGIFSMDEREWSRLISHDMETNYPEHRFLDLYIVPLSVADPQKGGAVVILRDVTRERLNAVQTIETEKLQAITLLAASVAHEIGNPLNSLTIHLQLLERELNELGAEQADHLKELVGVARQEITRLDQIINQFLRALRPAPVKLTSAHLGEILKQTLDFMRTEIENRGINVHINIPDDLPAALADTDQMRQAFFNVIKNAVQAMPDGGRLDLTLDASDRFVTVSFKDTGPGFSREHFGQMFEPFHTTKSDGSGLGLMIVQRIVRDHAGEMEVHSEPEHGATIILHIPREDQRVRLLKAHRTHPEGAPE